nr:hypothetical protein B0A51_05935 [Rachicladosporium sp. CCFEE 5018]
MSTSEDITRMVELIDLCDDGQLPDLREYVEIDEDDDDDVQYLGEACLDDETDASDNTSRFEIDPVVIQGKELRRNGTVELVDGDFMRVENMYVDVHGRTQLQGSLVRAQSTLTKGCSDVLLWRKYRGKDGSVGTSSPSKRKHGPADAAPFAQKRTSLPRSDATMITIEDDVDESEPEIVLVRRKSTPNSTSVARAGNNAPPKSAYTYGDICTGAGGMASGAVQAGLRMQFALDHDHDACETLRLNFNTRVLEEDVHTFCTKLKVRGYLRVDVLHISFPCKFYSPAHTVAGKDDEHNVATGYAVKPILERCRPRVVTFEQTFGMLRSANLPHFHALVKQATDAGYNVRWKLINLADFGNPHARKRLIIIASCPGEPLPRFPEPTHGSGPGKKPYTTIYQVLSRIDYATVPAYMQQYSEKRGAEYDPHQPLKQAITCSGGLGNLHPSGRRSFMPIELAALQTFRLSHRFHGTYTSIKTQIGNAVPCVFGKTFFGEIVEDMKEHDKTVADTLRIVKPYLQSERKSGTRDKESTKGDSEGDSRMEHDGGVCDGEDYDGKDCDEEDLDDRDLEDQYRDDQYSNDENPDDEYCDNDEYGDGGSSDSADDEPSGEKSSDDDEYNDIDLPAATRKRKRAPAQQAKRGRSKNRKGKQEAASGDVDGEDAEADEALILATLGLQCDDGEVIKLIGHGEGSTKAPGRDAS